MKIKKGTPCFLSKTGHNKFIYPIFSEDGLSCFENDINDYEIKSWICGKANLQAIIVEAEDIQDLYGSSKTVVWVEKKHLKEG